MWNLMICTAQPILCWW